MKFEYTEDQLEYRTVLREILGTAGRFHGRTAGQATTSGDTAEPTPVYNRELWSMLVREMQALDVHVRESEGGAGGTLHELSLLFSELGRSLVAVPAFETVSVLEYLRKAKFPEDISSTVGAVLSGQRSVGFARALGEDIDTTLVLDRDSVSGSIELCIGEKPESVLVQVSEDRVFLVDAALETVRVSKTESLDETRATFRLDLENAPVLIGALPEAARSYLDSFLRLLLASELEGVSAACLEAAVSYAKEREQYGRPIGSFQAVKHRCADMAIGLDGLQPTVMYAALALQEGYEDAALSSRIAFSTALETADVCASSNLQVHGGIGFTCEARPHLYFKRTVFDSSILNSPHTELSGIADAIGLSA